MILILTRKHDDIMPVLKALHWLPVKERIIFKLMTLTYQCHHDLTSPYHGFLLVRYPTVRSPRSYGYNLLPENKTRT